MLQISDLSIYYGKSIALRDVTLEVGGGEIVSLLGANGAGKSTTLRTISGLVVPRSGDILFEGKSVKGLPPHKIVKKGISHCPEGRRIFPDLTVYENLVMMGAYLRSDRKEVMESLANMYSLFPRLQERRNQKGGTLSGGEQQMLAIGRALMSKPSCSFWTSRRWGLRRRPCSISQRGFGRYMRWASPSFWSSRTLIWRWVFPTGPMSSKWGKSSYRARRRSLFNWIE